MDRSLLWATVVSWALWLLRRSLSRAAIRQTAGTRVHPGPAATPLQRDPWCGMYVSPEISLKLGLAGGTQHFCSAECRARYLQSTRRAASA